MGKSNRSNKKSRHVQKEDLTGESLMFDALRRISKINGKESSVPSSDTSDEIISSRNIVNVKLLTDQPQAEEPTPTEYSASISDDVSISSQRDYVDLKIGREFLNFERNLVKEISDGKSSVQKWGMALVVAAILASAGIMVAMQLFSTQQLKDFINNNFSEKYDEAITDINNEITHIKKEQANIQKTIDSAKIKNSQVIKKEKNPNQ